MTRFFLLPGQNYTGPGNSTSRAYRRRHPPTDALDRASLQHDLRYQRLIEREGRFRTYTHFSGADQAYLRRIQHLPGWRAGLARGVFKVKAAVAPTMAGRRSRSSSRASATPRKRQRVEPVRHRSASGSGHYKGRLPRPSAPPRAGAVAIRGHRAEVQQYGKVAHPYVAYLGAQVAPAGRIGQSVGMAFIRMVMKKHWHTEYTSTEQFLLAGNVGPGAAWINAIVPYDLRFWLRNANPTGPPSYTVEATYSFNANPAGTVRSFGEWFNANVFHGANFNGGTGAPFSGHELHAYQFSQFDVGNAASTVLSVVPLTGQYVRCYSTVRMHIQNVTPSDAVDVNSLSTDRVDSNPVKGRLLRFRGPTPVVSDDRGVEGVTTADFGWKLQQDTNGDGIIWPGAPQPTGQWSALPSANSFKNCAGIASISLEPGSIKDYSLSFKFSGTIQSLMRGFNASTSGNVPFPGGNAGANKQFGQSFMFALEKRMPTGAAAVMLNFNYENHYGAVFGGRPVQPMARQSVQLGTAVADTN